MTNLPTKPSPVKTKNNDYLAGDGMWYPSDELESYFKEKPKFNNMSSAVSALKELYNDKFTDLLYDKNPLLKMVK